MKRYVTGFFTMIVFALMGSATAFAQNALTVLNAAGDPGSAGNIVQIEMTNDTPVSGIELTLVDGSPDITPTAVRLGTRLGGTTFGVTSNIYDDSVKVVIVSLSGDSLEAGDGIAVEILYSVDPGASVGSTVPLILSNVVVSDPSGNSITEILNPGIFTIRETLPSTLSASSITALQGEDGTITVSLDNPDQVRAVSALEFKLTETPDNLDVVNVEVVGRAAAAGFIVGFNEVDGTLTVTLTSLGPVAPIGPTPLVDPSVIPPGTGPIVDITYTGTGLDNLGDTDLDFGEVIIADVDAIEMPQGTHTGGNFFVNAPPVAADDDTTTDEDTPIEIEVLANDTDGNEDDLTFFSLTDPPHGTVAITQNGQAIRYTPDGNYNGDDEFTYTIEDGRGATDEATVFVTVTAINDGPEITAPASETTDEDTPVTFSDQNNNEIRVEDVDVEETPGGELEVTMQGPGGTLTLAGTGGLSFSFGGDGQQSMGFTGTPSDINDALDGLVWSPPENSVVGGSLFIEVNDQGNTGGDPETAQVLIPITINPVNDAPSVTLSGDQSVDEDAGLQTVSGFATGFDPGPDNELGQLVADYIVSNDNNDLFSVQPDISNDGELVYTPADDANGTATVTVQVQDDGGTDNGGVDTSTEQTFAITVDPVNDAPSVTLSGDQSVDEDAGAQSVSGFATGFDPGAANESDQLVADYIVSNDNNDLFSVQPDISNDGELTYTPVADANGTATVTVQVQDDGGTDNDGVDTSAEQTFTITVSPVNDAPVLANIETAPLAYTENDEGVPITTTLTVGDVDDNAVMTEAFVSITGNYVEGEDVLAFLDQNGITGNFVTGTGVLTLSGETTAANYQTALQSVTYENTSENPSTDTRTVSFRTDDGVPLAPAPLVSSNVLTRDIEVTSINDAPEVVGPEEEAINEDTPLTFSAANGNPITVEDVDAGDGELEGTIEASSTVLLGNTGGLTSFNGNGTDFVTFTGSLAAINAALDGLVYDPTQNNDEGGGLFIEVSDQGNTGQGGNEVGSLEITINITPVNDAPVLSGIETSPLVYTENDEPTPITGTLIVNDVDNETMDGATVQIFDNYELNSDNLGFVNQNGITGVFDSNTGTLSLSGTAPAETYQTALQTVTYYNTSQNPSGATRVVQFSTDDGVSPLAPVPLESSNLVTREIQVIPVNDGPEVFAPGEVATDEDTPYTFGGENAIVVEDVDAGGGLLAVVLEATSTVTVVNTFDLHSLSGNGTSSVTFTGPLETINAALDGLVYTPDENFNGEGGLDISVNDQGNSGGEPETNQSSIFIGIIPVNDAPVITGPDGATINEDESLTFNTANGNLIAIDDVDVGETEGGELEVYIEASSTVTLSGITGLDITDGANGTSTVTFFGTLANINAALDGLVYNPTQDKDDAGSLFISVNDLGNTGEGGGVNIDHTVTITINPVNDAPVLSDIETAPLEYTENDVPVKITQTLVVNDVDNLTLEGAAVQITSGYQAGEDVLDATNLPSGIIASFDNGILTLSGTTTAANYQAAFRLVTYANTSENPSENPRTVRFTVDDGVTTQEVSEPVTRNIEVTAVNDAPVVTTTELPDASQDIAYSFTVTATDAENDALAFSLVNPPGWLSIGALNGVLSGTPTINDTFTVTVTIKVKDAPGDSSTKTLDLRVNPDTVAPAFTSGPSHQGVTDTRFTVVFSSNESVTAVIRYGEEGQTQTSLAVGASTSHNVTLTGLTGSTTYEYNVTIRDANLNSTTSAPATVTTKASPDTVEANFVALPQAIGRSDSSLTIAWEADEPVTAVVRLVTANGVTLNPNIVRSTTIFQRKDQVIIRGLNPSTTYDGQVELTDQSGNGPNKDPFNNNPARITARTLATPDIKPPVLTGGPNVKGITDKKATVLYATNEPAGTVVQYGLTVALGSQVVDSTLVLDHTTTLTGLAANTTYHYRVRAFDGSGNVVPFTAIKTFKTLPTPDITPPVYAFGPVTISTTDKTIILRWGTNELSNSVVRYKKTGAADSTTITLPTPTTDHVVTLTGLTPDTEYRYTVYSVDGSNNKGAERKGTARTLRAVDTQPPRFQTRPVVTFLGFDRFRVEWESDEASDSRGKAGTTETDTSIVVIDQSPVTKHVLTFTDLSPSTLYFWRVRMLDGSGNQAISALGSVRTKAAPDTIPPSPSGFAVNAGQTQAVIGFTTNPDVGDTRVLVSTDSAAVRQGNTSIAAVFEDATFVNNHTITATGLLANTKYYYRVQSTDPAGNTSALTPVTPIRFKTKNIPDTKAPNFLGKPSASAKAFEATITFKTNELANTSVRYDTVSSSLTKLAEDPALVDQHAITLTNLIPGKTYFYRVFASDQSNNTGQSPNPNAPLPTFKTDPVLVDSIPPLIVQRPTPEWRGGTEVIINWTTDENTDGNVFYKQDLETFYRSVADTRPGGRRPDHEVRITGLVAGTTYDFVVQSGDAAGNTVRFPNQTIVFKVNPGLFKIVALQQTQPGRFTTLQAPDTQAPVILSGPSITGRDANAVTITWVTDELSTSTVNFGANNTLDQSQDDGTLVTTHAMTLTNLSPSTVYSYAVSSTDPKNNGPSTSAQAVVSTTSQPDVSPPVITGDPAASSVFVSQTDGSKATITWTTNEPSDSKVDFGTTSALGETKAVSEAVTSHSVTITRLTPGGVYNYRVRSTDQSGNGPTQSGILNFTAATTPDLTAPVISSVSTSGTTNDRISVTWTTNEPGNSIVLAIEQGAVDTIRVEDGTLATSHSLAVTQDNSGNPVKASTTYNLIVESVDASGNTGVHTTSVTTPSAPDVTPPLAPTSLTATPGSEQAQLVWPAVTDQDLAGYDVYQNSARIASGVTQTTYDATGLNNGTTYTFEVRAVDQTGNVSTTNPTDTAIPAATLAPTKPTPAGTFISGVAADVVSLKPILVVGNATPVDGRPTPTYAFAVYGDAALTNLVVSESGVAQGDANNPTHWQVTDSSLPEEVALLDSTRYYWRSRANDTVTDGPWSDIDSFYTSSTKPVGVELASFIAESERGVVDLTWGTFQDIGINGFRVYRSLNADGGFELISSNLITGQGGQYEFSDWNVTVNAVYYYRLEAVNSVGVDQLFDPISVRVAPPNAYSLGQNYPNPFNPTTTIRYELPQTGYVTLSVYNLLGQEVVQLVESPQTAGFHTVQWNGLNTSKQRVSSGVYFYRIAIRTDGKTEFTSVRKMLLLK